MKRIQTVDEFNALKGTVTTFTSKVGTGSFTHTLQILNDALDLGLKVAYLSAITKKSEIIAAITSDNLENGSIFYPDEINKGNFDVSDFDVILTESVALLIPEDRAYVLRQHPNVATFLHMHESRRDLTIPELKESLPVDILTNSTRIYHFERIDNDFHYELIKNKFL